jgi:DNA-damage-inducible protein J
MSKTGYVHFRIDDTLKAQAEAVFSALGVRPSEALNLFYRQVALRQGLPFDVKIPNADTLQTFQNTDLGDDLTEHDNTEAMFKHLGI